MIDTTLGSKVMGSTLNVNAKFAEKMYRTLYRDALLVDDKQRSVGVFCVGFHNWLNGKAQALFIGEYAQSKSIIARQKRYIEKALGFTAQMEGETYITFGVATVSDTVLSLSMALLPEENAKRYRVIKADNIKTGNHSFMGIIDDEVGNTDIITPVVPETGTLPEFDKIVKTY